MRSRNRERGQVLIIVAVWLVALIGSAALILLTGSVEWQRNQLQQLADQAALDSALQVGLGCSAGSAGTVITEADNFLASQRTRTGTLTIGAGSCSAGYVGTDTFAGGLSASIRYPYLQHQQQVEVSLTLALPISFGNYAGASSTNVTRRAVAQQLSGSMPAVTAGALSCTGGQFNVGGTIEASSAIALAGGCAVYAHGRLDAVSSTYSDLGDVNVYANAQAWSAGGGACVANANSGSTNAVCADGHELSGHNATTCGTTGTTAYLVAADALVNANPCAGGTGAQPVAPVSVVLPPEPNADPAAVATLRNNAGGTLGASCSAAGVYPNISAGGSVVATGLGPAPVKDASGYYHFKPSCYGYIDLATMTGGGIGNRQTGPESARLRHFVIGTLPAASAAGTLLVATLTSDESPNRATAPAGWVVAAQADQAGAGRSEIWYYPSNPGGLSSFQFALNPATNFGEVQITEWSGVAAVSLDRTGSNAVAVATTTTVNAAAGATTVAGELAITDEAYTIAAGQTYTPGGGWTNIVKDTANGYSSEYALNLPIAVASETVTTSQATPWATTMATFKPSGSGGGGAVLDPGFYYFNGSGFAGGGGLCLNGGQLLGEDVTLEFVNQAGLSTGTCAAGGGASCASASCQLGSVPCSISACPPNTPADASSGGYTWFAAPCAAAPDAGTCAASSWCPTGDRACWNLLVWAPAANTGQIAIKGAVADHWLLGSIFWPGTCTDTVNDTSTIDGTIACGALNVSAAAGAGVAVGSDYGINTAIVETVLVE